MNIWRGVYSEWQLSQFADCNNHGDVFTLTPESVTVYGSITASTLGEQPVTSTVSHVSPEELSSTKGEVAVGILGKYYLI